MAQSDDSLSRRRGDPESEGGIRVLAVDDDPAYLRFVQLALSRAGFVVELAADGKGAIERCRRPPQVDILVIDLNMPGIDGIEAVRRINQSAPPFPPYTMLLTAVSGTDTKLRAFDAGLDDFLPKTATEPEIVAKIRSAGRRVQMERRLLLANQQLETLALTDELTGIANRRVLFGTGEDMLRRGQQLAIVLFDLERFKAVNDTYGHLAGDRVLADVAASLQSTTRYGDILGRYGGDEFFLLLPNTTLQEAQQIAERVAANIRQLRWTLNDTVLTMNSQYGVAVSAAGSTVSDLLATCDKLLYRGKGKGSARQAEGRAEVR